MEFCITSLVRIILNPEINYMIGVAQFDCLHGFLQNQFLFDMAEDIKNPYCQMNDSTVHTFHNNCNWSQLFLSEVIK